jgi:hypothetical protein
MRLAITKAEVNLRSLLIINIIQADRLYNIIANLSKSIIDKPYKIIILLFLASTIKGMTSRITLLLVQVIYEKESHIRPSHTFLLHL